MDRLKMYLLAASGIAILALTITLLNTSHAGAQQAAKIGPPPKPPTPVDVVQSDITLPVFDIDNARQPFQGSAHLKFAACVSTDVETIATVPNDKRLVIEHISAQGFLDGGNLFRQVEVQTEVANGGVQSHYLVMNLLENLAGDTVFAESQQARLYADPGTTVRAKAQHDFCGNGNLYVTISGYLVDVAQFQEIP